MSIPKVILRKVNRKSYSAYQIDYTLEGKRHRITVGNDPEIAESVRLDTQAKLIRGHFDLLPHSKKKTISLEQLIDEFLIFKVNSIRETSSSRYRNFLEGYKSAFKNYFRILFMMSQRPREIISNVVWTIYLKKVGVKKQ